LPRQAFGHQRPGNPGANDKRIAFDVLADFKAGRKSGPGNPRRTAASQVGLFGMIGIENADDGTSGR
jgi:hypothetical protein